MFEVKAHTDDQEFVGHAGPGPETRGAPWLVTVMLVVLVPAWNAVK